MNNKKNNAFVKLGAIVLIFALIILLAFGVFYVYINNNIDFSLDESLFISSKSGNITKFYYDETYGRGIYKPKELCTIEPTGNKKIWYSYDKIGENIKQAYICTEDRRFFKHHGVDYKRSAFALFNYIFHLKSKFGGSTITQQVIKNISGDDKPTAARKFNEIIRATHIEYSHSKEEIFELYLNIVPMGEGIAGVGLASKYYFGREPDDLTAAEAATLVGITNAPSRYNPHTNPDACIKKRNTVLRSMYECGIIDKNEYETESASELFVLEKNDEYNFINSWFIETVCDDLSKDLASEKNISESAARLLIMNGGLSVYTTQNPLIQKELERYFEDESNFPKAVKDGLNYSMVISDSHSGNLLGIVGNAGKKNANRLINNALTLHMPASTLKPLALYAPLLNVGRINWSTVFDDVPISFNKTENGDYIMYPHNYPDVYDGLTTVSDAVRVSKNTVALRLYNILGKKQIYENLKSDFGFDTIIESKTLDNGRVLTDLAESPLALGQLTYGISLRKLTEAYTVFPNEGELSKGRSYIAVYDSDGNFLIENTSESKRIYTKECARIMNQLLSLVTEFGTAKAITLDEIIDTAGKTGTSAGDKDRLFIGYTPYYTAGIWCGYSNQNRSVGTQSITHLEIWDRVMKSVHASTLNIDYSLDSFSTEGLEYLPFCKDSGEIYTEKCMLDPRGERIDFGYFTADNKPHDYCSRHILCLYDTETNALACPHCPRENLNIIALLDISERKFPTEIYVSDAQYVWRNINKEIMPGDSFDVPFFIYALDEGEFVGKSKGKKQFNSYCYLHND